LGLWDLFPKPFDSTDPENKDFVDGISKRLLAEANGSEH